MKRITISLPDDLAVAVAREAKRRDFSVSQMARQALEASMGRDAKSERRVLPFASLGRSGYRNTARDIDAILEREWLVDRDR
jgi:predicted transcriptional regulator